MLLTARDISPALRQGAAPPALNEILRLRSGRAHELCGPARRVLAAWIMAQQPKGAPVLWIRPRWNADRLHPYGLHDWASPEGLIVVDAARETEAMGCAEEALRSGAVALVVVEMPTPPPLTPLRRLHLAAESGLERRRTHNREAGLLALILTPGDGGAPGVESRWQLAPCPAMNPPRRDLILPAWTLRRLRARMAPPAAWRISRPQKDGPLHCTPQDVA